MSPEYPYPVFTPPKEPTLNAEMDFLDDLYHAWEASVLDWEDRVAREARALLASRPVWLKRIRVEFRIIVADSGHEVTTDIRWRVDP